MEEELLQVPCDFKKYESMPNNKMKLTFVTQEEIPKHLQAAIVSNNDKYGWLCFLAGEKRVSASEVLNLPKLEKEPEEKISPAQLFRSVCFRLWEHLGKPTETSDAFYRREMEKITNHYKDKLN